VGARNAGDKPWRTVGCQTAHLLLPKGKAVAIELDLTAKRSKNADNRNHSRSAYAGVWCFVLPGSVERLDAVERASPATNGLIEVHPWAG
jgi:hypothetical protein